MLRAMFALALGLTSLGSAQAGFIAATWNDNSIHVLDNNFNNLSSFPTAATNPNGTAFDGTLIYSAHFTNNTVYAYNMAGVVQSSFSNGLVSGVQGLEFVNGSLAIASGSNIHFVNPTSGVLNYTIPGISTSTEGVAYDGTLLWVLDNNIVGLNPLTGAVVSTLPNPAGNDSFGGTGLATDGFGVLAIASTNGNWYRINSANGVLISSGNNGLNHYALSEFGAPTPNANAVPLPPTVLLALGGLATIVLRRRKA